MRDFDPTASEFISSGYLERSTRKYDPATIATTAGPPILGSLMGSDASSSAADAQVQSSKEANALQKYIFDTQRGDQKQIYDQQRGDQLPFRQAGLTAQNRLMTLLGLGGSPGATGARPMQSMSQQMQPPASYMQPQSMTSDGVRNQLQAGESMPFAGGQPMDMNALRAQLLPQFSTPGAGLNSANNGAVAGGHNENIGGESTFVPDDPNAPGGVPNTVDEAGLQAAIQQRMQPSQQPSQPQTSMQQGGTQFDSSGNQMPSPGPIDSSAPEYGSLMKDFTAQDFNQGMDPGYEWRKQQGLQAVERSAAAGGGLFSGAAGKAMNEYAQGSASQEYGAAFNRFQTNRSNKLNPLQSLMGAGQTATNQVGSAGQNYGSQLGQGAMNYGNQASQNITGAGNARASGYMGQANALAGGMGQAYNNYQQNSMIDLYRQRENRLGGGGGGGGGGYESWQTTGNGMPGGYK